MSLIGPIKKVKYFALTERFPIGLSCFLSRSGLEHPLIYDIRGPTSSEYLYWPIILFYKFPFSIILKKFKLTLCLIVSSAYNLCKQFGPRSGLTNVEPDLDPNCFDTLMVFLKEFLKKVDFEKNRHTTKKYAKIPSRQRVILTLVYTVIQLV